MATYAGFNTQYTDQIKTPQQQRGVVPTVGSLSSPIQAGKKFRLTDEQLVIQDFINALNIPMGQKPGNPGYGTTLWGFIFEPNDVQTRDMLTDELTRVANLDPRLNLTDINVYAADYGLLVELQMTVNPYDNVMVMQIIFDQATGKAYAGQ